jgi:transposase
MVARGGRRSPFAVTLTASQRKFFKALVRRQAAQQRQVTRARIVLLAGAGWANQAIARKLGVAPNTVGKWRKRFCREGVDGLADRKRSGRPRVFPPVVVAYAKAVACELPRTRGVPLPRWSLAELRAELLVSEVSSNDAVALAGRGSDQAVAAPLVDLSPRPCLRRQGWGGLGPVPAGLPGSGAG